jgi:hypothetical protein
MRVREEQGAGGRYTHTKHDSSHLLPEEYCV